MMNIREYFETLLSTTNDIDLVEDLETKVSDMDDDELEFWAQKNGVDLTATEVVGGTEYLVHTLWIWDMD